MGNRVTVTLAPELIERMDLAAQERRVGRSEIIREAVECLLGQDADRSLRTKRRGAASARTVEIMVVAGRRFTVEVEQLPRNGWWVGLVKELPGCGSQGATLDELREMVADAITEYLVARGDIAADAKAA